MGDGVSALEDSPPASACASWAGREAAAPLAAPIHLGSGGGRGEGRRFGGGPRRGGRASRAIVLQIPACRGRQVWRRAVAASGGGGDGRWDRAQAPPCTPIHSSLLSGAASTAGSGYQGLQRCRTHPRPQTAHPTCGQTRQEHQHDCRAHHAAATALRARVQVCASPTARRNMAGAVPRYPPQRRAFSLPVS